MDKQAFIDAALAEMAAVYRLAVFLSNRHEADDLVQETYVRAFRSIATYRPGEHGMRPWLFKILHNVLYDRLSDDQRRRLAMERLRDEQASRSDDGPTAPVSAAHSIDWEQIDERLRSAIDRLPLHQRSVFLLSAIEGLRYREIAAVLDVPIGTVMSRLCRARATLASLLSGIASAKGMTAERDLRRGDAGTPLSSQEPPPVTVRKRGDHEPS